MRDREADDKSRMMFQQDTGASACLAAPSIMAADRETCAWAFSASATPGSSPFSFCMNKKHGPLLSSFLPPQPWQFSPRIFHLDHDVALHCSPCLHLGPSKPSSTLQSQITLASSLFTIPLPYLKPFRGIPSPTQRRKPKLRSMS